MSLAAIRRRAVAVGFLPIGVAVVAILLPFALARWVTLWSPVWGLWVLGLGLLLGWGLVDLTLLRLTDGWPRVGADAIELADESTVIIGTRSVGLAGRYRQTLKYVFAGQLLEGELIWGRYPSSQIVLRVNPASPGEFLCAERVGRFWPASLALAFAILLVEPALLWGDVSLGRFGFSAVVGPIWLILWLALRRLAVEDTVTGRSVPAHDAWGIRVRRRRRRG